jgi:hypothetical protein
MLSYAFVACPGSLLKNFVEPSSGCTGTISGGETSRAKDVGTSELPTHPSNSPILETSGKKTTGRGRVPPKKLMIVLRDDEEFQFCPSSEEDQAGTLQSASQCTAHTKAVAGPREDVPESVLLLWEEEANGTSI